MPEGGRKQAIELGSDAVAAIRAGTRDSVTVHLPIGRRALQPGDLLWVREPHRWRGAKYASEVPEEYASEPGELDWSCAEIEWFRVHGSGPQDSWEVTFPDDFMYGAAFEYEELDGPEHDEGPDVIGYLSERLPARRMPRWASRLTLAIVETSPHPDARVTYRVEAIGRNVDDLRVR